MPDEPSESDGSVEPEEKPDEVPDLKYMFYKSRQRPESSKFSKNKTARGYDKK